MAVTALMLGTLYVPRIALPACVDAFATRAAAVTQFSAAK